MYPCTVPYSSQRIPDHPDEVVQNPKGTLAKPESMPTINPAVCDRKVPYETTKDEFSSQTYPKGSKYPNKRAFTGPDIAEHERLLVPD